VGINDVFFGTSALYSDGWNTVIRNKGGALYVQDFNGNDTPVVASQFVSPGGNGVQVGNSYYYGDSYNSAIRQQGGLYVQNQDGSAYANIYGAYMYIGGIGAIGAGCSPNGLLGQDGSGSLLYCVNGVWQGPSAGGGTGTLCGAAQDSNGGIGTTCHGLNPYLQGCPAGYVRATIVSIKGEQVYSCVQQ
jgi:hypothetical protein